MQNGRTRPDAIELLLEFHLLETKDLTANACKCRCQSSKLGRCVDRSDPKSSGQESLSISSRTAARIEDVTSGAQLCQKTVVEIPQVHMKGRLAIALGRKNWLHIGSPQAGHKIAAILSVVESCRRLQLRVRDYLAAILPGLADLPIQRLPNLTPAAWVAQYS